MKYTRLSQNVYFIGVVERHQDEALKHLNPDPNLYKVQHNFLLHQSFLGVYLSYTSNSNLDVIGVGPVTGDGKSWDIGHVKSLVYPFPSLEQMSDKEFQQFIDLELEPLISNYWLEFKNIPYKAALHRQIKHIDSITDDNLIEHTDGLMFDYTVVYDQIKDCIESMVYKEKMDSENPKWVYTERPLYVRSTLN